MAKRASSWAAPSSSRSPSVALPSALDAAASRYERIALNGDWQRDGERGTSRCATSRVTRGGRAWPVGRAQRSNSHAMRRAASSGSRCASAFVRLEDITPFLAPLPDSRLLDSWLALAPRGDLRDAST